MKTKPTITHDSGVVVQKNNGYYQVLTGQGLIRCTLSHQLQTGGTAAGRNGKISRTPSPDRTSIAIGDQVDCSSGQIVSVEPRRNCLSRRSARPMPDSFAAQQVIVANIDQLVPVFAVSEPAPHWNMLDRYLTAAAAEEIPARVVISKHDLLQQLPEADRIEIENTVAMYRELGYPVHWISSRTGEGISELLAALQGQISVLVGKSGVGKSSLLNAIQPGLGLKVSTVNQVTGKGRHTTTALEMIPLETGGAIVDTPGVREFGLWEVPLDTLDQLFPEFVPFLGKCRFGASCRHAEEPGCAIRRAATEEIIYPRRYFSYLHLLQDS